MKRSATDNHAASFDCTEILCELIFRARWFICTGAIEGIFEKDNSCHFLMTQVAFNKAFMVLHIVSRYDRRHRLHSYLDRMSKQVRYHGIHRRKTVLLYLNSTMLFMMEIQSLTSLHISVDMLVWWMWLHLRDVFDKTNTKAKEWRGNVL